MFADPYLIVRPLEADYAVPPWTPHLTARGDLVAAEASGGIRVLLVITKLAFGGATNVVIDIARQFQEHPRIEVHVASGHVDDGEIDLTRLARDQGVRTIAVPSLGNELNPWRAVNAIRELRDIMRRGRYDIVHTHSSIGGVVGRTAAVLAGVPLIVHHVHGWGLQEGMSPALRFAYLGLERLCATFTDRLIAVSKPTIQKGIDNGIAGAAKFELIYNGIAIEEFQQAADDQAVRAELGMDPGAGIVATIGRLDRQKNPLDFIQAAALVAREYAPVQFVMIGEGVLRPDCERLIDGLGLRDRFLLPGFRSDVQRIMPALTVVACSSLWEGLPLVFQEAMCAGKPIVANDVDGASDVVVDGETGYLVPPHTPDQMAERILRLLRDEPLRQRMGTTAARYSQNFGRDRMFAQLESLYTDLATAYLWAPAGEPTWATT